MSAGGLPGPQSSGKGLGMAGSDEVLKWGSSSCRRLRGEMTPIRSCRAWDPAAHIRGSAQKPTAGGLRRVSGPPEPTPHPAQLATIHRWASRRADDETWHPYAVGCHTAAMGRGF